MSTLASALPNTPPTPIYRLKSMTRFTTMAKLKGLYSNN
jgi:hypothetical protein